jgi:DNA adenine methylase
MTNPILKWPGGKRKLVPTILEIGGAHDRVVEPFAGGMALGLASDKPVIASDLNKRLIACYEAIRDDVEGVIVALGRMLYDYVSADDLRCCYDEAREVYNDSVTGAVQPTAQAARLLFLNRTCFNGLYRENKSGAFNVPHGKHASPPTVRADDLRAVSERLQAFWLLRLTFSATLMLAGPGDLVYCDPPYDGGFVQYTRHGFDWQAQRNLAHWASRAADRGARVLVSNADTHRIRALYGGYGFRVHEVQAGRSISRDADGRGTVGELILSKGCRR